MLIKESMYTFSFKLMEMIQYPSCGDERGGNLLLNQEDLLLLSLESYNMLPQSFLSRSDKKVIVVDIKDRLQIHLENHIIISIIKCSELKCLL